MPFTSYNETTEEITLKTAQLTNKITTLTMDELNNIKYIQQAVCSKVIKKEHQQPIMEEFVTRHKIEDRVLFLGFRDDVNILMSKAQALFVPSRFVWFCR